MGGIFDIYGVLCRRYLRDQITKYVSSCWVCEGTINWLLILPWERLEFIIAPAWHHEHPKWLLLSRLCNNWTSCWLRPFMNLPRHSFHFHCASVTPHPPPPPVIVILSCHCPSPPPASNQPITIRISFALQSASTFNSVPGFQTQCWRPELPRVGQHRIRGACFGLRPKDFLVRKGLTEASVFI